MTKTFLLACLLLSVTLPAKAQLDEAFAKKFSENWCRCTDKNTKKLAPELKEIMTNTVRNPIGDTLMNAQPYYDYLAKNPAQNKLEDKATDKIAQCTVRAFKAEAKQYGTTYFVRNVLGNNKSISRMTKHNDIATFYYTVLFSKLAKQYNIELKRTKKE